MGNAITGGAIASSTASTVGSGIEGVGVYGSNPNLAPNGQKIDTTSKSLCESIFIPC